MKMLLILVFVVLGGLTGVREANADVYQVHLYYDHGQLFFDRNQDPKVMVLQIGRGGGDGLNRPGSFKAEILNKAGEVLYSDSFDPRPGMFWDAPQTGGARGGFAWLDQGPTAIRLLYASNGTKLKIYDATGKLILEHDISYLANLASMSPGPIPSQVPQTNAQSTGIAWYWWALVLIILSIVAFVIWKRRRKGESADQSPS